MRKQTILRWALFSTLGLAGCLKTPAVIADLETDKVVVQSGMGTTEEDVWAKAREGCALHDRLPKPLSAKCVDQYCLSKNLLFACVKP